MVDMGARAAHFEANWHNAELVIELRNAEITELRMAGGTLSAYIYSISQPSRIPESIRQAMLVFDGSVAR